MLSLDNQTRFEARAVPLRDREGFPVVVFIVKATYDVNPDGTWQLAEEQTPLVEADEHYGDPAESSVQYESDLAIFKPATDVLLIGSAHAPSGEEAEQLDISFSVGPVTKSIRVFGDRHWKTGILSTRISDPEPFTTLPLTFDNAFGGTDTSHPDERKHTWEQRNPVGKGFRTNSTISEQPEKSLDGWPLPNLEDPAQSIRSWSDKPAPTAPGFICRSWPDRLEFSGTYDEQWIKNRCPLLPADFDYRYFNAAPKDQICDGYLKGGESVRLVHVTPEGELNYSLPRVDLGLDARCLKQTVRQTLPLDTVLLCTDLSQCILMWRSSIRYRDSLDDFGTAMVYESNGSQPGGAGDEL